MGAAAKSLYFLIVFTVSLISFASAQNKNQFIYNGFNDSNLHLDGLAKTQPNGLLQLTNTSELQSGHAFYPLPFIFNTSSSESLSFSTNFVFSIVPAPGMLNFNGHGMAFVITPSLDFSQAIASAYLGVFNTSNNGLSKKHILAIELDTVESAEFKDINGNHVGIDVDSPVSNASTPAAYFSDKEGKNKSLELVSGDPIQVWIDYNGAEKLLNVTLAPTGIPKPKRPLLSRYMDLSQIFLNSMYVGFSAATATRVSNHYILGWSFNKSGQAQDLDMLKLPPAPPRPIPPLQGKDGDEQEVLIVVLVVAAVIVLVTIGGAFYIVRKKKYEEVYEDWEKEYGPHRFSFKNLYKATKGFKENEVIGEGGFGKVYKGILPSSNVEIAVKKVSHDSKQGMTAFVAEIVSMGRLRHRNMVHLLGYCRRKGELLLVYEYMPNGSLDKMLYSISEPILNWFQRFRVLKGIASGLLYLHEESEQVVLHRDIKPANILLDADLNGKLGDFGLARLHERGSDLLTTNLVGTVGYMAPELLRTGKATTSTDVFSFGACMLEVACGRKPIEQEEFGGRTNLVGYVLDCWRRGAIHEASDPRLGGLYVEEQVKLILILGLFCSHPNPAARPTMRQVMQYLDGDTTFPDITPDNALIDAFTAASNEASDIMLSFPSLFGNSTQTMSTMDSILIVGR